MSGPSEPVCAAERLRRQQPASPLDRRRTSRLESFALWVSVFSAVLFGCFFVLATGLGRAALWAAVAATAAALLWLGVRLGHPPAVELADAEEPDAPEPGDDEGGWDVSSFLMAAVVVPVFFVVAMLVRGWLTVVIVVGIALFADDATGWDVAVAVVSAITVSTNAEFGINLPLMRRWGFALD